MWLDLLEPWTDFRSEVDELTDLGDRVVMQGRQVARREGLSSGGGPGGRGTLTLSSGRSGAEEV